MTLVANKIITLHIWGVVLIFIFMKVGRLVGQDPEAVPIAEEKKGCAEPLGMYNGKILDSQLTASSSYRIQALPKYARLGRRFPRSSDGAWCPSQNSKTYPDRNGGPYYNQYLQIDFGRLMRVRAIRTEGRIRFQEKTEYYRLNYTRLDGSAFQYGTVHSKGNPKLLKGNEQAQKRMDQWLNPSLVASTLRIIPQIYPDNPVCLRFELFGCNFTQGVVSYTVPQGNNLTIGSSIFSLQDNTYDGILIDKTLSSGLGKLTDGILGNRDVRPGNRDRNWMGWNRGMVTTPYILFQFDQQRVFRSVTFVCNLRDEAGITLFSTVAITSSINGKNFGRAVKYNTQEQSSGDFYRVFNVTVNICGVTGKYIRAEFAYRAEWIVLSEVMFDSEVDSLSTRSSLGCIPVTFPTQIISTTQTITNTESTTRSSNFSLSASEKNGSTNAGLIAGIVCGTLVFILLLLVLFCWWRYKNWKLHGEKPFNHFIKIEVWPHNTNHGNQRISRLSSCAEEKIDPDIELCPVYASITEEKGKLEVNTYEEPPGAKTGTNSLKSIGTNSWKSTSTSSRKSTGTNSRKSTGTNSRKSTGFGMKKPPKNSVKKPKKPPPGPPVLVNGTASTNKAAGTEENYAEPSTPLLNETLENKESYYAEPESPTAKGPLQTAGMVSLPESSKGKQDIEDSYYAEPESPKDKLLPFDIKLPRTKSKPSKKNKNKNKPVEATVPEKPLEQSNPQVFKPPPSGYAEPIDAVSQNNNEDLIQNPIYEEIYSEPFQGVSGTSLYANPTDELARADTIVEFPRAKLKFKEKIGDGQFGEVHIGEAEDLEEFIGLEPTGSATTVAIKVLKTDVAKDIKEDFFKEVKIMARLKHENVVQLLGVCKDDPMLMIVEYMINGDLNQFLSEHRLGSGPEVHTDKVLTHQALMYMSLQVASGMKYISSLNYVHRDLATRNLLVGHSYTVKIADFGMSRNTYCKHYYRVRGKAILPIRWMAPECILQGKFTTESDVWSYGVTVWEILTLAGYPYSEISDEKVIENVHKIFYDVTTSEPAIVLEQPDQCEDDVYEMMKSCWCRMPSDRPTFETLYEFFKPHVHLSEITI